jgi:hypothetical protein
VNPYVVVTGVERCPGTARAPQYPRFVPAYAESATEVQQSPQYAMVAPRPAQEEERVNPYVVVTGVERCPGTARAPQYPHFRPTNGMSAADPWAPEQLADLCDQRTLSSESSSSRAKQQQEKEVRANPYVVVTGVERCPGTARAPQYPRFVPVYGESAMEAQHNPQYDVVAPRSAHERPKESAYVVVTGVERCPGTARAPQYPHFRPTNGASAVDSWAPEQLADLCVQRKLWSDSSSSHAYERVGSGLHR